MAAFLRHLLRQIHGPIIALLDNGKIHRGEPVQALLARTRRLHLEPFPAYAPELNPDEGVWNQLKRRLANGRPDTKAELMDVLRQEICRLASSQQLLRGCIRQSGQSDVAAVGGAHELGRDAQRVAGALHASLDHGRHGLLTGFPSGVLGYAQWQNGALMVLAPLTGVVGLSLVTALGSFAVVELVRALRRRMCPSHQALAAVATTALALVAGAVAVSRDVEPAQVERLRVAVLQGHIDQGVRWDADRAETTLAIYEDLTRQAAAAGAQLVPWPETAVPGSIETENNPQGVRR